MSNKKAYVIRDDYEEGNSVVRFGTTKKEAKSLACGELNCSEEEIENCERAPQFDKYVELGYVPSHALIEAGWWIECTNCSTKVTSDLEGYEGEALSPIYENHRLFCSPDCHMSFYDRRREEKENCEKVSHEALKKWPGIEITHTNGYERDIMVEFKFPESLGTVTWRLNATNVYVQQRDIENWNKFTQSLKKEKS